MISITINWIAVLTVSLLMAWSVGTDIEEHKGRRSRWWIAVAFFVSFPGAMVYLVYDRVKK